MAAAAAVATITHVDAEVAGLVGALGGAAVGAAGAWVAAVITFRGARYQADRQRQAAHEQWLRQIRRDAYAEFLLHARTGVSLLCGVDRPASPGEFAEIEAAINGMRTAMGALLLEAPENIRNTADAVYTRTRFLHGKLVRGDIEEGQRRATARRLQEVYRLLLAGFSQSLQDSEYTGPPTGLP
jgi:hypothetical protein